MKGLFHRLNEALWAIIANLVCMPAVTRWLIERAQLTPYSHIRNNGMTYMERYWLFNPYKTDGSYRSRWRWLPSIRVHHIMLPDPDRHLHDHPWKARTIVLSGGYSQEVTTQLFMKTMRELAAEVKGQLPERWAESLQRGDTARIVPEVFHRIQYLRAGNPCWTLFLTWGAAGDWGFLVGERKVGWKKYLSEGGPYGSD